jgi:hypothetical protein
MVFPVVISRENSVESPIFQGNWHYFVILRQGKYRFGLRENFPRDKIIQYFINIKISVKLSLFFIKNRKNNPIISYEQQCVGLNKIFIMKYTMVVWVS